MYFYGITWITLHPQTNIYCQRDKKNAFRPDPPPSPLPKKNTPHFGPLQPDVPTNTLLLAFFLFVLLLFLLVLLLWRLGPFWGHGLPDLLPLNFHFICCLSIPRPTNTRTSTMQSGLFCSLVRHSQKNIKRLMPFGNSAGRTQFK